MRCVEKYGFKIARTCGNFEKPQLEFKRVSKKDWQAPYIVNKKKFECVQNVQNEQWHGDIY